MSWLAPDQWLGLEALFIEGRLRTDRDLFERLDRALVYEPDRFTALDLDRHRLSLDDRDHERFTAAQKAIAGGATDPVLARHRQARIGIDRALERHGIDTGGPEAADIRAEMRGRLDDFEVIDGRAPNGANIDAIVLRSMGQIAPDNRNIVPAAAGDLKCVGGDCARGGNRGSTGMYSIEGRTLCESCAVKRLGIGGQPAGEKVRDLAPVLIGK
jgi:hypothetical protein